MAELNSNHWELATSSSSHLCHTFFPVAPNLDAVAVTTFRLRVTLSFLLPFAKQYCQECTRTFVMGILSSLKHCTHIYFSESSEFRRAAALPHSCDDGLKTLCLPSSHYYLSSKYLHTYVGPGSSSSFFFKKWADKNNTRETTPEVWKVFQFEYLL